MSVEDGKSRVRSRRGAVQDKAVIELGVPPVEMNSVEIIPPSAVVKSKVGKKAQAVITLDSEGGTEFIPDSEVEASLAVPNASVGIVKSESSTTNADPTSSHKNATATTSKEIKSVSSSSRGTGKGPKIVSPSKLRFMLLQKERDLSLNKGSSSHKPVNGHSKPKVMVLSPKPSEGGEGNSSIEMHVSDTSASPSFLPGTQDPEVDISRVVKKATRRVKEKAAPAVAVAVAQPKVLEGSDSAGLAMQGDVVAVVFTGDPSKKLTPDLTVEPLVKSKRILAKKKAALAEPDKNEEQEESTPNDLNLSQDIAEGPVVPVKKKKMVPSWYQPKSATSQADSTKPEENPVKEDSPVKAINNSTINTEPILPPSTSKGKKVQIKASSESVLLAKKIKGHLRAADLETSNTNVKTEGLEEDESLLIQQLKGYKIRTTRSQSKLGHAVLHPAAPPSPRTRPKPSTIRSATATEPSSLVLEVDNAKEKIGSKKKTNSEALLNTSTTKVKARIVIPDEKVGKLVSVKEGAKSSASATVEEPEDEYDTAEEEGNDDNDVTLTVQSHETSKKDQGTGATDDAEVGPEFEDANDTTLRINDGIEEPLCDHVIKLQLVKEEEEMEASPNTSNSSTPPFLVPKSFNFGRLSVSYSEINRSQDLFETQSSGETPEEMQSTEESVTPEKVLQETTNLVLGSKGSQGGDGESGQKVADQDKGMETSPGEPLVKGILKRRNSERLSFDSNIPRKKLCFSQVTEVYNLDPIVRESHQALSSPLVVKKISPIRRLPYSSRSRTQRNNLKAFSFIYTGNCGQLPSLREKDPFFTSTPIPSRGREMLELSLAAASSSKPPKGPSGGANGPISGSYSPVAEVLEEKSLEHSSLAAEGSVSVCSSADAVVHIAEQSLWNEEVGKPPELTDSYRYCLDMDVVKEPDPVAEDPELGVGYNKEGAVALTLKEAGDGETDRSDNATYKNDTGVKKNASAISDAEPIVGDLNAEPTAAGNCVVVGDVGDEMMDVQTSLEGECLKLPVTNVPVVTEMEEDSEINLSGVIDPATTFQDSLSFSAEKFYTLAYPSLVDCQEPVEQVLLRLTSNASVDILKRALKSKKIATIGDLCSISKFKIQQLPIMSPRFLTFENAMKEIERDLRGIDTSADKQAGNQDEVICPNNGPLNAQQDDDFSASFQNGQNPFEGSLGIVGNLLGMSTQTSQVSSSLESNSTKNSEQLEREDESVKDETAKSLKVNLPSSDRDFEWSEVFSANDSPKNTAVTTISKLIQADAPVPSSPVLVKTLFNDFNFLNQLKEELASDSVESRRLIQFIVADKQVAAALLQPLLSREDLFRGFGGNTSTSLIEALKSAAVHHLSVKDRKDLLHALINSFGSE